MTVNTATATASYLGNGATQVFAIPFYFLVDTDLKVSKRVAASGVTSVLALNSDYTISGAGNNAGGFATVLVAPAAGDQIFIERNVTAVQQTSYPENSRFPSASHEKALDRLTMLCQQFLAKIPFGLFRDPLGATYDLGNGTLTNAGAAVAGTDIPNLAQVQALATSVSSGILPGLIATYTDLISTLSGKGAALVSFLQAGTGAIARTVLDKLRERVSVKDFGAVGNGTTDDTAAIQAAINYAISVGKSVFLPAGVYKISNTLTINAATEIVGDGWQPYSAYSLTGTPGLGSWISVTHTGSPAILVTQIAGGQTNGVKLRNFAMKWAHAAPGVGWTPTVYDFAIKVYGCADVTVEDMLLLNPYRGIQITGSLSTPAGRLNLDRVFGQPFNVGIDIDLSVDVSSIRRVHFWPFWSDNVNVLNWQKANGATFLRLARSDNTQISDIFGFGFQYGILITANAVGTASGTFGTNVSFDDTKRGIWIAANAQASSGAFSNVYLNANPAEVGADIFVGEADGANYQFSNLTISNSQQFGISVVGNNGNYKFSGIRILSWNITATGCAAFNVGTACRAYVTNHELTNGHGGGILTGAGILSIEEWIPFTGNVISSTGALTAASMTVAKYKRINNTVEVQLEASVTNAGTGGGSLRMPIPFVAKGPAMLVGRERNTVGKALVGQVLAAGTSCDVYNYDNTFPGISASVCTVTGFYEAA
jgi:hypothetical protein